MREEEEPEIAGGSRTANSPLTGLRAAQLQNKQGQSVDAPTRDWLLQKLRDILEIAMERVTYTRTLSQDRMKWSRIVIAAGQACNSVLRDVEIEALKQQIKELKELMLAKLSDEQADDQEGDTETSTDD